MKRHLVSLEEDIFASDNSAVLLIEDDEITREITTGMLQYLGYTVEAVGRGEEAVALYKLRKEEGNPFKAFIFGICRPKCLDAKETLGQLMEYDPGVKAIASSALTADRTMDDPAASGFRAPLPKYCGIKELGSVLRAVIGPRGDKERMANTRKVTRQGIAARFRFVMGGRSENMCEGIAINISKHGLGFLTEEVFTEGQAIRVTGLQNIDGYKARVMWVKKGPRYYRAGAKFVQSR